MELHHRAPPPEQPQAQETTPAPTVRFFFLGAPTRCRRWAAGKGDWTLGRRHRRDQGNAGCAILEKHMPVKGKLVAVGVKYAGTEYRVLDGFNYRMPKSEFTSQRRSRSSAVWLQGIKARWELSPSTYLNNSMKPEISVKSPRIETFERLVAFESHGS